MEAINLDQSSIGKKNPNILYRYAMVIATKRSAEGENFNTVFNESLKLLISAYEKDNLPHGNWKEVADIGEKLMNNQLEKNDDNNLDPYGNLIGEELDIDFEQSLNTKSQAEHFTYE